MRLGLWLLLLAGVLPQASTQTLIRVLLDEVESVNVSFSGSHRGYVDGAYRFDTALGLSWPLSVQRGVLWLDGRQLGRSITLEPTSGELISWDGRAYRGSLRFLAHGERIRVVNVVDLEAYLRGVVPAEMQASWPLEALKAQAVAARTYLLYKMKPYEAFDVCATIECQVYRGVEVEHPRSDQAITETAGLVLTHGGDFARTYYHADSGGVLASSTEVWGYSRPYLYARADVSSASPHRQWTFQLDPAVIAGSLRANGYDVGDVNSLSVLAYSDSGRVVRAAIGGSLGQVTLEGDRLRRMLRGWGMKSTRFTMIGALTARGDGWGHGVGMSQYGAKALAQNSYSFEQILAFYYPDTQLQRLATQASLR